jgi:cytochrome c-type biogenesis protein CcmH/NrfG
VVDRHVDLGNGRPLFSFQKHLVSGALQAQNDPNRRPRGGVMEITYRRDYGFRLLARLRWKHAVLCALIIDLLPMPLFAQKPRMTYKSGQVVMLPQTPDDRVVVDQGDAKPNVGEEKLCSLQPFPGMPSTASVTSLQIPHKAQKEYEHACAALKNKKLPEAEQHLRKATQIYPKYVAGWVMLGQTLETRRQTAEARNSCSRASSADPNYLPAYLCLAEIAGREQEWDEVLKLTTRALELDAVNDAYAYFFSAIAYFNLNQLREAEERALKAETIDREHNEPLLQLLLAQIYEAKKDAAGAAAHLREYLKLAPQAQDSDKLKKVLAEAQNPK